MPTCICRSRVVVLIRMTRTLTHSRVVIAWLSWKGPRAITSRRHSWLSLAINGTLTVMITSATTAPISAPITIEWTKVIYQIVIIPLDVIIAAGVLLVSVTLHCIRLAVAESAGVSGATSWVAWECNWSSLLAVVVIVLVQCVRWQVLVAIAGTAETTVFVCCLVVG